MPPERVIELYPQQYDFVTGADRRSAFVGGIGSGKTKAGCLRALRFADGADGALPVPNLGMITAPTYPMLRDATLRTFVDEAGSHIGEFHKGELRATMRNGSEVLFRSADDPERLRGPNLSWYYSDEAALCEGLSWQIGIGRLRQFGQAGYAWLTTTPRGRNWIWDRFVKDVDGEHRLYRARTADNPYLDTEYIADLERDYVGRFAEQELGGEFVAFEGLVYDEVDREIHVWRKALPDFKRVIAGVDWGYTNPAVVLVIGVDGDDRAYVVDEFYQRRMRLDEHKDAASRLQERWGIEVFECDPSEPEHIDEFRYAGLNARGANNAVVPGIQVVKARLWVQGDGRPRLYFTPQAANTMAEMESYAWKERRQTGLQDQPEKVNDHAMDALRYALVGIDSAVSAKDMFSFA